MQKFEVERTTLNTKYGTYNFYCFSWGKHEEDNILEIRKTFRFWIKKVSFIPSSLGVK